MCQITVLIICILKWWWWGVVLSQHIAPTAHRQDLHVQEAVKCRSIVLIDA